MKSTYLSFLICGELYAVDVSRVLEVLQKQQITKVPNAPDYIKGIINFRGEVVPVFESRTKLELTDREVNEPYVIVVFDLSSGNELMRLGAIVDRVQDVFSIEDKEIKPVPAMSKDFNASYLQGIYKHEDQFILLLNIEKMFSTQELHEINNEALTV